jgi:hypothetical protein
MIESNDGGANVSTDGGKTWTPQDNQPTAQFYRVSTDDDFPYRLLGAQQDNSAVRIRSRSALGPAISVRDWEPTSGGESGHIVARPGEPDVVYGGSYGGYLTVLDHRTGERRAVNVWPDNPMGWGAAELPYRFQWNFPLFFSPHDPDLLYAAANVLFRTRDGGACWQAISGDLTRDDKSKMGPSGGPITKDNTSIEYYGTIFAALESPHEPGVLWTGSDDGLVQVSRDHGETWTDVTPKTLPEWSQVNSLEAHPFEPGGLYLAATRYKLDDFAPYLYLTTDYGNTWKKIDAGIDPAHFTRAVRADPDRRGLLYAGTERGVYVSFDDGGSWRPLQGNLPVVPVTDLAVKEKDLIAATQGRGFWILDDLTPLHQHDPATAEEPARLLAPRTTVRGPAGRDRDEPVNMGKNPPAGVVLHFWLAEEPAAETAVELEILEEDGDPIRTYTRKPKDEDKKKDGDEDQDEDAQLELQQGMNRFEWDLRYPAAKKFPKLILWNRRLDGPRAVPGTYRARLSVGDPDADGWTGETSFEIVPDPRSSATAEDHRAQFDFLIAVRDKLSEVHGEIARIRQARGQIEDLGKRLKGREGTEDVTAAGEELAEKLTAIEEALYQTKNQSRQDPLNFPIRLNDKLAGLLGLAAFGDRRPTEPMLAVRDELTAAIDAELEKLQALWDEDLPAFNRVAREQEVPAVLLGD